VGSLLQSARLHTAGPFLPPQRSREEARTLYRFQGEFARLFGPYRRGRSFDFGDREIDKDYDDLHPYHLSREQKYR